MMPSPGRLQPWSERKSSIEQERLFKRLIALHTLTDAWIQTLSPKEAPSHHLDRMAKVTLNPNLWQFEKNRLDHLPLNLEELVGAQEIDTFLSELSETIWIIQSSTLENAESSDPDQVELRNVLEQASWAHGKAYAESIWGPSGDFLLKEGVEAFLETHIYSKDAFLIERSSPREISVVWRKSPMQNPSLRNSKALGLLCRLHEHWIGGFFYGVSRKSRIETGTTQIRGEVIPRFSLLAAY